MRDMAHDADDVAPPGPALSVTGLRLSAGGTPRIDIPKLCLPAGRITMILGANGAGKSLLLRLLHGLVVPEAGQVDALAGRQAMVFQRPVLLRRSVAGNLRHGLKAAGVPRAERRARVAALLAQSGLADRARQPARTLSGGEQQRLALVRALSTAPEILFLDEPTASLDPRATRAIETLVLGAAARGTTVVMVTHDPVQARRLGCDVVLLDQGRVVEQGPAARFFTAPQSPQGRAYLGGTLPYQA